MRRWMCVLVLSVSSTAVAAQSAPPSTAKTQKPALVADRATMLAQAAKAQKAGNAKEAMRLYRLAADRHRSVQAYLELARLQSRAGDQKAALVTLTQARELAPNSEEVLGAFAQVSMATQRPLEAVLALRAMTRMYATVPQYHYLLGVGLMRVGDMQPAIDSLSEANRLEPDHPLTMLALGLALNERKEYAQARSLLTRSLDLQPENVDATAALAEAEAGLANFDEAAALAGRALARAPGNATAQLVAGLVAMERRQYPEARDALLKALALDPDAPKIAYQLSLAFARLGDDASSKRYLEMYREKQRLMEERVTALRTGSPPPAEKKNQ